MPLAAAALLLGAPFAGSVQAAMVISDIFQAGNNVDLTNTSINYTITNDDIGAT